MRQTPKKSQLAAALILASTSVATAATLPNPPFSGGGFIPPTYDVLRQEEAVEQDLRGYLKRRIRCDRYAVAALQLAYTPVNNDKVTEVQTKWQACVAYADQYYTYRRDLQVQRGTPACLDQAGIDAQKAALDASMGSIAGQIYCDSDGAAPDPVTGLNIPDAKQESIGETELARVAVSAQLIAAKCYAKGVRYAQKLGILFGQDSIDRIEACLARVNDYAADEIADLDQKQKLPACLPVAAAQAAVDEAIDFPRTSTAAIYCAE